MGAVPGPDVLSDPPPRVSPRIVASKAIAATTATMIKGFRCRAATPLLRPDSASVSCHDRDSIWGASDPRGGGGTDGASSTGPSDIGEPYVELPYTDPPFAAGRRMGAPYSAAPCAGPA